MIQATPTCTKSLKYRAAAIENQQTAAANVIPKPPKQSKSDSRVPVMKDIGTWTPSRKQHLSLEHLKSKFTAKSSVATDVGMTTTNASMEDLILPWKLFKSPLESQQQPSLNANAASKDYSNMLHELDVSHAVMTASKFKPIDFVQAEKLVQKFQYLQQLVNALYDRIRVQTDTQRAVTTAFKLDQSSMADFIQDICQSSQQITLLVDEFYFTSQSAHRTEATYLQHLAATLATAIQSKQYLPQEDIHRALTKIFVKLEATFNHYDDNVHQQHVSTFSSSSSSSSSSSTSSTSSFSTSSSGFTQTNSINTSSSTLYTATTTTTTSDTANTLHQKIDNTIEKLSRQLKQKQELLRVMEIQSNTHEELARQRERSASLVLELERSRSKRQLIAKNQEKDMTMLRDQLMQETLRRQSLQDRVTSLEHTLKSKESELNKLKNQPLVIKKEETHDSCQFQIKQLQQELKDKEKKEEEEEEKKKENLSLQQKTNAVEQRGVELQQIIKDYSEKERIRTFQEKNILDQCQNVMNIEYTSCEKAVASTIAYLTERQQAHHIITNVPTSDSKQLQQQMLQLQKEFNQAKHTFTTRESAFILQSASTEAELERILKEYDRLTRNIVDFNNERKKFEEEISVLHQDKQLLEKRVCDDKVSTIKESSLRKEFRSLMASVKDKHKKAILQELEKQRQLEQELRDIKSDSEIKRWEKVDVAVQTHYFDIVA